MEKTVLAVSGVLRVFVISLNLLGVYCLYQQKQRKDTQKIILYNLSAVEMTMQITWSIMQVLDQLAHTNTADVKYRIALACHGGVNLLFYLVMVSMTLDRFLRVILGIKYKHFVGVKIIARMYIAFWSVGLSISVPVFYLMGVELAETVIYTYGFASCDAIFMFTAVITYTTIAYMLLASQKKYVERTPSESSHTEYKISVRSKRGADHLEKLHHKRQKRFLQRKQAIPFMIVISYAIFYAIPDFTLLIYRDKTFLYIATICWSFGFVTDPLIYIFLHKPTRVIACSVCKSLFQN